MTAGFACVLRSGKCTIFFVFIPNQMKVLIKKVPYISNFLRLRRVFLTRMKKVRKKINLSIVLTGNVAND